MFKVNSKDNDVIDVVLVSLLLTSKIFHTFFSASIFEFEQVNFCCVLPEIQRFKDSVSYQSGILFEIVLNLLGKLLRNWEIHWEKLRWLKRILSVIIFLKDSLLVWKVILQGKLKFKNLSLGLTLSWRFLYDRDFVTKEFKNIWLTLSRRFSI